MSLPSQNGTKQTPKRKRAPPKNESLLPHSVAVAAQPEVTISVGLFDGADGFRDAFRSLLIDEHVKRSAKKEQNTNNKTNNNNNKNKGVLCHTTQQR